MIITNRDLIEHLKKNGELCSKNLIEALESVDRGDFVGERNTLFAYLDNALPIGYEQTISQPLTVVFMLELLNIQKGNTVMEIGFGSAWQTCLIANMVGERGSVFSIELIPELYRFGLENSDKYPNLKKRIRFFNQNGKNGLQDIADGISGFDRIICSAELKEVPEIWIEQLKTEGIMVYPKNKGIYKIIKKENGKIDEEFYPGFIFVPFVEN